ELNGHPLLDRQVRKRLHQPVTQLLRLHWFVAREWLQQGFKVLAGRDAGRRPERVSRAAVGDSENPGRGLRVSAEVACLAPHDQERVVDDLFSDIEVAGEACQKASQPAVIEVVQLLQSAPVASCDSRNQLSLTGRSGASAV